MEDKAYTERNRELGKNLAFTKQFLSEKYEVNNLSLAEELLLKDIIKKTLIDEKQIISDSRSGKTIGVEWFDVKVEATYRWLFQIYGINIHEYKDIIVVHDLGRPVFKYWINQEETAIKRYIDYKSGFPEGRIYIEKYMSTNARNKLKDDILIKRDTSFLL